MKVPAYILGPLSWKTAFCRKGQGSPVGTHLKTELLWQRRPVVSMAGFGKGLPVGQGRWILALRGYSALVRPHLESFIQVWVPSTEMFHPNGKHPMKVQRDDKAFHEERLNDLWLFNLQRKKVQGGFSPYISVFSQYIVACTVYSSWRKNIRKTEWRSSQVVVSIHDVFSCMYHYEENKIPETTGMVWEEWVTLHWLSDYLIKFSGFCCWKLIIIRQSLIFYAQLSK